MRQSTNLYVPVAIKTPGGLYVSNGALSHEHRETFYLHGSNLYDAMANKYTIIPKKEGYVELKRSLGTPGLLTAISGKVYEQPHSSHATKFGLELVF